MFPDIFLSAALAVDLHGTIDDAPNFFRPLLNLIVAAGRSVYIVSGPPKTQIKEELTALGLHKWAHYTGIFSVVDDLKQQGVKMWQDDNGRLML